MKSYQDKLIAGLLAIGCIEEPTRSKYRMFTRQGWRGRFFVGSHGALRYGQTGATSHSAGNPAMKTRFFMNVISAGEHSSAADSLKLMLQERENAAKLKSSEEDKRFGQPHYGHDSE